MYAKWFVSYLTLKKKFIYFLLKNKLPAVGANRSACAIAGTQKRVT
jgi:hypothetical protein